MTVVSIEPTELQHADGYLNQVCYNLMKREEYGLAKRILSFATSLPRHYSQESKLIFVVNTAIAYKWGGEPDKSKKLIEGSDWSACSDKFQLAVAALEDDFDKAAKIMRNIGSNGSVKKADYKDWPAFKDFRQSEQFLDAYKSIFGEYLETVSVPEDSLLDNQDEILQSAKDDIES
jgi:hypothetical protein